jgi:hypothetical protein
VIYRPVEGVDWDFIRSIPEFGFVGNDLEAGRRGGNFDGPAVGDGDEVGPLVRSIAGIGVAGGTRGWVVCSALAAGRVKTDC